MGLIGACLGALLYDFALVLMSPLAFLSHPARWLWAIHRHRATLTAAPNFAYELCLNKIRDEELSGLDLSSLRLAFNGAEPVSADTVERFCERFGRYGFRRSAMTPVYGLAECALGLTFTSPGAGPHIELVDRDALRRRGVAAAAALDAPSPLRMVSCGSPLPGHLLRIADERASPLPERRQGRIQFRGPSATSGYYRNAEDTARLKHGEWLDTGDLGYLADGELYVTGRAKDIIIRGGQNLHPQELEEAVGRLEGVRKGGVAVFAAADPARGTERVVVVAETTETEAERCARLERAIRALAVDLLGTPPDEVVLARPRTVLKTSSGKIRRAACREAFERGELGAEARVSWRSLVRLGAARGRARSVRTVRRLLARAWGIYALVAFWSIATIAWLAIVSAPGLMRRRKLARAFARIALASCALAPRVIRASPSPLPPRCIVIANHASYLDGVLLTAVLPPRFAFVAKREFAPQRLLGTFLRRLGAVFVERDEWALAAASGRRLQDPLGRGQSLIVFPEGTFRRDPGLLPFRSGAFIAAAATATPLIPTTIRGARAALADGMRLPRRVPLEIVFDDSQMPGGADWHAAIAAQQRVRETLLGRLGEPDADTPGERSGASLAHVS
jgi:1-acyl-sn-glycerol-3-phosphate acyltransferase